MALVSQQLVESSSSKPWLPGLDVRVHVVICPDQKEERLNYRD
jgi:hypothetical protein